MEHTDKRSSADALTSGQVVELAWQSLTKQQRERLILPTVAETMNRSKRVLAETRLVLKQSRAALAQSQRDRERLVKRRLRSVWLRNAAPWRCVTMTI